MRIPQSIKATFLLASLFIASCETDTPVTPRSVAMQFGMQTREKGSGREHSSNDPAFVIFSVTDTNNVAVFTNKTLSLYRFGSQWMSESIEMAAKNGYLLTSFVVTDVNKNVIYAAPLSGTMMAKYVQDPLPLKFNVNENASSIVSPEVLSVTANAFAEAYGYAGFGFNLVNANLSGKVKRIENYQDGSLLKTTDFYYNAKAELKYSITNWVYGGASDLLDSIVYDYSRPDTVRWQTFGSDQVANKIQMVFANGKLKQYSQTDRFDATNYQWDYQYDVAGHIEQIVRSPLNRYGQVIPSPSITRIIYETDSHGTIKSYTSWQYLNGVPTRKWFTRTVTFGNSISQFSNVCEQLPPFQSVLLPNVKMPVSFGRSVLYDQNNTAIDTCDFGYNYVPSQSMRSLDIIDVNPEACHIVYDEPDLGVVNKYIFW